MKKTEMTDQDLKNENVEKDTEVKVELKNMKDKSDQIGDNEEDDLELSSNQEQEIESEEDTISLLESELKTVSDKYLRLIAEFDNFKKRAAKEKNEMRLTAGKEILVDLLPVLDDLYRAQEVVEKATDVSAVKEGFNLIKEKLLKNLASKGLEEMEVLGEEFDSDRHEAVAEFPAPTEDAKGKVFDVTLRGYVLNDRIIRFPKVVVSK